MKKIILIIVMAMAAMVVINAQTSSDTITVKKVLGGYQYIKADIPLTFPQLLAVLESNPQAFEKVKSVKSKYGFIMGLSYVGGSFIGYPLGQFIGGGEPLWPLAGIGAVIVAIALPMAKKLDDQTKEAVDIYNTGKQKTSFWDNTELRLSMTENGVGFALRF